MNSKQDEGGVDINNRQRKFGLPGWMVNNIERLNFVTDFEQYGSSPPETESFLTEYMENYDRTSVQQEYHTGQSVDLHKEKRESEIQTSTKDEASPPLSPVASERLTLPCHSVLSHIRHEDLYSSPDSTPCVTPEPSPVIRRKISIPHPQDTLQTNPGRWFCVGKLQKKDAKVKGHSVVDGKVDCGAALKPKKTAVKLVISNFDLNAVSPTSW